MHRVAYVCSTNGWSLHNVGLALVEPMAERGVRVDVVADEAWHAAPTPADVVFLAHRDHRRPDFPYRDWAGSLVVVVHDPDEVSTFYDRLSWAREPMHERPEFDAYDRVLTCSREMVDVLRGRYGLDPYFAPTHPHNADAVLAARRPPDDGRGGDGRGGAVRFISTAFGADPVPVPRVLGRAADARYWTRDEHGRPSLRQARSALVRQHRKNTPWLDRLAGALADDARADVDFRYGRGHAQLSAEDYVRRIADADVYVCTSVMEGGPLPVMEAVLAGLAVLTTPVGQTAEWVRHGWNGFVCRTPDEFAWAARVYLDRPDVLRRHQARSRQLAATKAFNADAWHAFLVGERQDRPAPVSAQAAD